MRDIAFASQKLTFLRQIVGMRDVDPYTPSEPSIRRKPKNLRKLRFLSSAVNKKY